MTDYIETPAEMVAEFMLAFEPPRTKEFWLKLVYEEVTETIEAIAHLLKEFSDMDYVMGGLLNSVGPDIMRTTIEKDERLADSLDALLTLRELIFPDSIVNEAFRRVHASNMSKLGDDGKPIRREDGKVLKGPNYKPPHLIDLITA
jgi:predicted HAD superfamily Cof-like phosphohydrolase